MFQKILVFVKKRWYILLILAVGVGWYLNQQRITQAKIAKESTYTVDRQDMKELLSLAGEISADEHVILRFQTSGRLAWVGVKEGDAVKKYQTLATLDQRDLKKNLQKKLLTYAQTRNSFDQTGSDNQRVGDQPTTDWGLGDKMKRLLENAQYGLDSSVLDVELTQLSIEYSNLFTPIEGIVTRADSKYAGVNITPSQAEFEIINPSTLFFAFTADQTEVTKLSEGMKGDIALDSFPDKTNTGDLYYVSYTPKVGESGTVYEGRVRIPEITASQYRFGMTGDVTFVLNEKRNIVVVQDKLIKSEGDKKFVWKKVNGQQVKTYVTTGLETDGLVEILKGVESGDVILNVQT
jgi:membrane fusion protein, multidrug efflux system